MLTFGRDYQSVKLELNLGTITGSYLHLLQFPKLSQLRENIFIGNFNGKAKIWSKNTSSVKDDVIECMRAHLELGINTEEFSSADRYGISACARNRGRGRSAEMNGIVCLVSRSSWFYN